MALSSMTGFARGHGVAGTYAWAWEIKSVNSKGLDLKLRLPPGWDAIEAAGAQRAPPRRWRAARVFANLTVEPRRRGAGGARQRAGAGRGAGRRSRGSSGKVDGRAADASTASSRSRA